jgi:hypothetical protein
MKTKNKGINSFFGFPDRINLLTGFLIIVVYSLIIALITNLALPKIDYHVRLDYPAGEYNEDINPYLFVRGTPEKTEDNEIEVNYSLYAYIRPVSANKPTNVRYSCSALDRDGIMRYFFEASKSGYSIPLTHHTTVTNFKSVGFSKYFIKVIYNQILDEDNVSKVLRISEEVLTLGKKELNDEAFNNSEVDLSFKIKDINEDKYEGFITVDPLDKEAKYHINLQSWLVTKDGKIYPFLGLYNYSHQAKFNPSYQSTIYKNLNVDYIYAKLECRDLDGNISRIYYKEAIGNLLEN